MAYTPPTSNNIQFQLKSYTPPASNTIGFELDAGGGTVYEVTQIESNTVNDILNRPLVNYISSRVESNTASDTTDSTKISTVLASIVEVTTAFDNTTPLATLRISQSENNVAGDSTSYTIQYPVNRVESTTASDSIQPLATFKPLQIENNLATDNLNTPLVHYTTSIIESTTTLDSSVLVTPVNIVENNIANDSLNTTILFGSSIVESTTANDTYNVLANFKSSVSELNSAIDNLISPTIRYPISHVENNIANDLQQTTTLSIVHTNESNIAIDNNNVISNLSVNQTESVVTTDAHVTITSFTQTQNENTVSESTQNGISILRQNVVESTTLTDIITSQATTTFTESNIAQSNQSCIITSIVNYNENAITSDNSSASKNTSVIQNESNNVIEFCNGFTTTKSETIESTTATDVVHSNIIYHTFVNESFELSDEPGLVLTYDVEIEEDFNLTSNENQLFSTEHIEYTTVQIIGASLEDITNSVWGYSSTNVNPSTAGSILNGAFNKMQLLKHSQVGNWEIINNQLLIYDLDNVELFRYNLYDRNHSPSTKEVFKRELAG
jgi:hypothetical protein